MKPYATLIAVVGFSACLAACSGSDSETVPADGVQTTTAEAGTTKLGEDITAASAPLADNAPSFASLYPGANLLKAPVLANGPSGPGGMAEFTTEATPEEVVEHYRKLADQHDLKPVMSMNQGDARAFAAINDNGAEIRVVASAAENALTTVQITWASGQ